MENGCTGLDIETWKLWSNYINYRGKMYNENGHKWKRRNEALSPLSQDHNHFFKKTILRRLEILHSSL